MAAITLFGVPQSSYVWSARMTLRENGIAYDLEHRDLKQPEYRALHPFAGMPAFRDGDLTVYETAAIMAYVQFPSRRARKGRLDAFGRLGARA